MAEPRKPIAKTLLSYSASGTPARRYILALATVVIATVLMFGLYTFVGIDRGRVPFIFYFGAVIVAARYGGLGPGLLSVGLSALVAAFLFLPPFNALKADKDSLLQVFVFALIGSTIVYLTERSRRAEMAAQASEQWLKITLESIGDAVIATDVKGCVTFMNPVAERLTGWTIDEAKERKLAEIFQIVNDDSRQPVENPVERVVRENRVVGLANHTLLISKDGRESSIEDTGAPIRDSVGRTLGVVLVFHDITDRLARERKLKESEERLITTAATASDAIITIDTHSKIIYVNPACERIFGYVASELVGQQLTTLMPEYLRHVHELAFKRYLETGKKHIAWQGVELPGLHHDGHEIPLEVSFAQFTQEGQTFFTGIARDISARRASELALKESEERYRGLVEQARDIIYSHDLEGRFTSVNAVCERIVGYTPDEMLKMKTVDILAPEFLGISREMFRRKLDEGATSTVYEVEFITRDGNRVPIEVNSYLIYEDGKPTGVQGIWRDITERKRVEDAIRQSEERYRLLFESNPQPMWVFDRETLAFMAVNDAAIAHYGYTLDEFLSMTIKDIRPHEDLPRLMANLAVTRPGFDQVESWRHRKKDGTIIDVEIASHTLEFLGRSAVLVLATDVTERKRAVEELQISETRYRALADAMPQIVWTARADGYVDYYNERWFEYTGLTLEQTVGWGWQRAIHSEDLENTLRTWATAVANGTSSQVEYRFRRASDNSYRWHLSRSEPLRDSEGRVIKWFGTATDIHDQKLAEERASFLAEANQLLSSSLDYETTLSRLARLCVESLADFCLIDLIGEDGTTHRVASAHRDSTKSTLVAELRKYPPDMSKAEGVPEVLRTGKPMLISKLTEKKLDGMARSAEHRQILRSLNPLSFMAVPLVTRGRPVGAITFTSVDPNRSYSQRDLGFAEELARRASVAIDNALLYRRAQEANRAKDEFLATLSHELRTPLTPIVGWIQMIRDGHISTADTAQGVDVIARNSEALLRLISDLLDMTSIQSGKMRIQRSPVDLQEVVNEAAETIKVYADRVDVTVEFTSYIDNSPILILGDRTRLVQVFWNLLSNAVKFSPPGSKVRLETIRAADKAIVSISDDGLGIDREFLPHIFERFTQADSSTKRVHGGLGIGLALVKSLVMAHGGTVTAASAGKGRGSCFTVELPTLRQVDDAGGVESRMLIDGESEYLPKFGAEFLSELRPDMPTKAPKGRVLIVEDAGDTLELLRIVFKLRGYDVTACGSSEEALAVAPSARFDIIVSDIGLPRIDGYELITRLREMPHLQETPAMALTGYASRKDAETALAAGFDGHVPKPVEPSRLAEETDRLIRAKSRHENDDD